MARDEVIEGKRVLSRAGWCSGYELEYKSQGQDDNVYLFI